MGLILLRLVVDVLVYSLYFVFFAFFAIGPGLLRGLLVTGRWW